MVRVVIVAIACAAVISSCGQGDVPGDRKVAQSGPRLTELGPSRPLPQVSAGFGSYEVSLVAGRRLLPEGREHFIGYVIGSAQSFGFTIEVGDRTEISEADARAALEFYEERGETTQRDSEAIANSWAYWECPVLTVEKHLPSSTWHMSLGGDRVRMDPKPFFETLKLALADLDKLKKAKPSFSP